MWRRIGKLLIGAVAMIASAGWYVALVSLWPADSRPYIAGSTDNNLLQLALGYNGIERVVGGDGGPRWRRPGGGGGARNLFFGGDPGIGRLFGQSMGTEASWLLPAALIGLVAGLWFTRRTARTGRVRAGLLLWGGWLLVTGAVFSFMGGTIHPYYTVALAPAIAALVAISVRELWRGKEFLLPRGSCWRSCRRSPGCGRSSCWTALRTGCRRCAGSCWPVRWSAASVLAVGAHRLGRATRRTGNRRNGFRSRRDRRIHHRDRRACAQRPDDQLRAQDDQPRWRRRQADRADADLAAPSRTTPNWRRSSVTPTTVGPRPVSDRSPRAAWSSRPAHRSWRSAVSPAPTTRPRWRSSSSTSPTTQVRYFIAGDTAVAARRQVGPAPATSRPGCSRTSRPSMSAAPPCTT